MPTSAPLIIGNFTGAIASVIHARNDRSGLRLITVTSAHIVGAVILVRVARVQATWSVNGAGWSAERLPTRLVGANRC